MSTRLQTLLIVWLAALSAAWAKPGKRGLGWPWDNSLSPALFGTGTGQVSWIYNWELWTPGNTPANMTYVSMARTNSSGSNVSGYMANTGSKTLFCLNEPDNAGQANMNVQQAVAFWQTYCQPQAAKGIKLIAPAITNGVSNSPPMGFTYLSQFLKACTNCTIDGINLHWYGSQLSDLKAHINQAAALYPGKPIWLTEFAPTNVTTTFMKQALAFLDGNKNVTHYAWFGAFPNKYNGQTSGMITNGKLNALGRTYVTYKS